MVHYLDRRSGGNEVNRRRTGEEGKRGNRNRDATRWNSLQRSDDSYGLYRGLSLSQLYGHVRRSAKGTAGMSNGTVCMGVRDLHCARNHHQDEAHQRQQHFPRRPGSGCLANAAHTR